MNFFYNLGGPILILFMAIIANDDNKLHVLLWLCRFILLLHHLLVCFSEVMYNVVILQHLL